MTKQQTKRLLTILSLSVLSLGAFSHGAMAAREMIEYPRIKLQSLDKATARTLTFEAKVGSTLKFGSLYLKVKTCQKSSPIDEPESAAFLQIWEVDTNGQSNWAFSGWMFASSPALSAMDHPIYDVWVIDCLDYDEKEEAPVESDGDADGVIDGDSAAPMPATQAPITPNPELQEN